MSNQKANICRKCGIEKPITEFWLKKGNRSGHHNECKVCFENRRRAYRKARPDIALNQSLRDRFGITLDEYKQKLLQQKGVCAICGKPETLTFKGKLRSLSVDHNHITNQIRGLLCDSCNKVIGFAKEDISILESTVRYLTFWLNI